MEAVQEFTYLGDRVSAGGGCEAAVIARTICGWVKFMECCELLYGRRFPLRQKGAFYKSYVKPAMQYGSEAWYLTESEMGIFQRTERSMVRAMCGVQRKDRERSTGLMFMLGLLEVMDQLAMANCFCWYCHVLRREDGHVLRREDCHVLRRDDCHVLRGEDGHVLRMEDGYVLRRGDGLVLRVEDGHVLRR